MLKKSLFSMLFISALLFQGCFDSEEEKSKQVEQISALVKNNNEYVLTSTDSTQFVVLKTQDGLTLKENEGKIVIFDIFATWCPPCQASAEHLSAIQKKFNKDVVVIGLTIEDNIPNTKLEKFKSKYHANYTIANSSENRRLINEIATQLQLGARFPIPLMAIYKDGKLIQHYIGAVEEEFVVSDIKQALGK
jgi:thiol-disulfide isomerase/thioredoxin